MSAGDDPSKGFNAMTALNQINKVDKRGELGPNGFAVGFVLIKYANKSGHAYPSVNTIAKITCRSRSSVRTGISELEGAGWLVIDRSDGGAKTSTNRYKVVIPEPGQQLTPSIDGQTPPIVDHPPPNTEGVPLQLLDPLQPGNPSSDPSSDPARELLEAWNHWAGRNDRPAARLTQKRRPKVLARIGEGLTWAAVVQELERLDAFGLGRTDRWNGITFQWLTDNEENWTKLAAGNYRRKAPQDRERAMVAPGQKAAW